MRGIVVCPEPPAAIAGGRIFEDGGNAFDVAVATAFAQASSNPLACGLGGRAQMQIYTESHGVGLHLNAGVSVGSAYRPGRFKVASTTKSEQAGRFFVDGESNQVGYTSIMTPGFVAGMEELWSRFGSGKISWPRLLEPATEIASKGFPVYPYFQSYYTFEGLDRPGYPDVFRKLAHDQHATGIFLPQGRIPGIGFVVRQPELAHTLRRIADRSASEFYRGAIGREISEDFRIHSAFITAEDLASYVVRTESPIIMAWRDLVLQTAPPPARGAVLLAMLRAVEDIDIVSLGFNSPAYVDLLSRVSSRAYEYANVLADPVHTSVPIERVLSKKRARAGLASPMAASRHEETNGHTTSVAVADSVGNVVAVTHSIGSVAGAGVMTPGLGFLYNNFLGHLNPSPGFHDSIIPGKRVGPGCPTIVFRHGKPVLAIGSSGGSRQVSSVFQSFLNVFVHKMEPQEAVSVSRFHCEEGQRLYLEPTFPKQTIVNLQALGYETVITDYMGCNQIVHLSGSSLSGGTDPRGGMGVAIL